MGHGAMTSKSAAVAGGCLSNPAQANCTDYVYPTADAVSELPAPCPSCRQLQQLDFIIIRAFSHSVYGIVAPPLSPKVLAFLICDPGSPQQQQQQQCSKNLKATSAGLAVLRALSSILSLSHTEHCGMCHC